MKTRFLRNIAAAAAAAMIFTALGTSASAQPMAMAAGYRSANGALAENTARTDDLSEDQKKLISLTVEDHDAAVRYYHENMIYPGINGTYILGEEAENELSLLSEKTLLSFEKSGSGQAEDQMFTLCIYTDRNRSYSIKIPTKTRNVYTAEELLETVPKNEKIVFAVFHFNAYEYEGEEVSFLFREYSDPWVSVNGKDYFILSDGTVLTKSATIDGIRYTFDKSGVCQGKYTGYTDSGKGRRYWKNGELVKNKWIRVKSVRKYYADENGYFVTGTREIGGKTFVFGENGTLEK